jgi:fumarylacetoacetase-like protein
MRLVTYDRGGARRLGAWVDEALVDLPDAVGHPAFPTTMEALASCAGGTTMDAARDALDRPEYWEPSVQRRPRLLVPILPPLLDAAWLFAPGTAIRWPPNGELAYEVKVAAIVGASRTVRTKRAVVPVFGYSLVIGWMAVVPDPGTRVRRFLGATLGPTIVTADDLDASGKEVLLRHDGDEVASESIGPLVPQLQAQLQRAARQHGLLPGQIVGSSALFAAARRRGSLRPEPGAVVEATMSGVGTLRVAVSGREGRTANGDIDASNDRSKDPPAPWADGRASLRLLTQARPADRVTG